MTPAPMNPMVIFFKGLSCHPEQAELVSAPLKDLSLFFTKDAKRME
jgi:hypothetical protein